MATEKCKTIKKSFQVSCYGECPIFYQRLNCELLNFDLFREDKKWVSHNYNKKKWPRTQDLLNTYILNSAALIAKRSIYIKYADRLCRNPLPIICGAKSGFDVDDLNDFNYVKDILKKNGSKSKKFKI